MNDRSKAQKRDLAKMLGIIQKEPGIRPKEINRLMGREHSASLRNALIKQGLVRKKRDGQAVRYYRVN